MDLVLGLSHLLTALCSLVGLATFILGHGMELL